MSARVHGPEMNSMLILAKFQGSARVSRAGERVFAIANFP